jgi:hypothetical protein
MPAVAVVVLAVLVLMVGALTAGARVRIQFAGADGAFRCKLRARYDRLPGIRRRWPLWPTYARWVHDVLLVQRGLLCPRTVALPVRMPEQVIRDGSGWSLRGLGDGPLRLDLRLDDGRLVEVAAPGTARTLLTGPYLAAAIPGLPLARRERPYPSR